MYMFTKLTSFVLNGQWLMINLIDILIHLLVLNRYQSVADAYLDLSIDSWREYMQLNEHELWLKNPVVRMK
jgi:hypothetical protein